MSYQSVSLARSVFAPLRARKTAAGAGAAPPRPHLIALLVAAAGRAVPDQDEELCRIQIEPSLTLYCSSLLDSALTNDTASRSSLFATRIRNRCRNLVPFHAA